MFKEISFGAWLPDIPPFNNPGLIVAKNVMPEANSYRPFPTFTGFSLAITARCQGTILVRDASDSAQHYAGDDQRLYKLDQTTASWSNVSRLVGGSYSTPAAGNWDFAQWGNTLIAVNGPHADVPQRISLGAANFVVLPGSPPPAACIAVVRDFVVVGNLSATAYQPQMVQWSAINNSDSWTADAATLADRQDLPGDGGPIQKIIGGEYGLIFQRRAIFRMTFVGSPLVFQFDKIHRNIGAYAANSVVSYMGMVYFYAESGFYAFDGVNLKPIGASRVDRLVSEAIDTSKLYLMHGIIYPNKKLVCWAWKDDQGGGFLCNKIIIYNWEMDSWSIVESLNVEKLMEISESAIIPYSTLGAFDSTHTGKKLSTQSGGGATLAVQLETGDFQLNPEPNGWACITRVMPLIEAQSMPCMVVVKTRERLGITASAATSVSVGASNFAPLRVSNRFHRIQINISGSTGIGSNVGPMRLQGLQIEFDPEGER